MTSADAQRRLAGADKSGFISLGGLGLLKRYVAALVVALVLAGGLVSPVALASPLPVQRSEQSREHIPGELVVRYAAGADPADLREQYKLEGPERLNFPHTELVHVDPGTVTETAAALTADPDVLYAEPNYVVRAAGVPNDPYFPQLWGLHQSSDADVDAPQAWDLTTGASDVTVAVVDTGIAIDHPELAPSIWRNPGESGGGKEANGVDDDGNGFVDDFQGWDWIGDDSYPRDLHGHGTHVAGIVGARGNDGTGIAGLSWGTKIMALRALNSQGEGTTAELAAAFAYAARKGAKVVNVSLGGSGHSLAVLNAITAAPDTLFAVAAGNAGANNDVSSSYPCNYPAPNIVCVAATDSNDQLASFSNYGATTVDLAAPGTGILSLQPSFATRFSEDFVTDLAPAWTTGGVNGTWTRSPEGFAVDSADSDYQDDADHWIATRAPFDLGGMNDCLLRYSLKLDVEENDRIVTEASANGSDWTRLGAWTGSSDGQWTRITDPLFEFDGRPAVHLRFRFVSDSAITRDGASLDSIGVRCNSTTYSGSELLYAGGTSMATPHVAGAAALAWSAAPGSSVADVVKALIDGADDKAALFGKTISGGRLNACRTIAVLTEATADVCSDQAMPAPASTSSPPPAPTATPEPTASPSPASTPAPVSSPSPEPTPEPETSPEPTPAPSQEPTPAPEEQPREVTVHDRFVRLRLEPGLLARGRVRATDGFEACASHVLVKISRNGRVVARLETRADGRFEIALPDKPGRYVARAPQVAVDESDVCARARSKTRKA